MAFVIQIHSSSNPPSNLGAKNFQNGGNSFLAHPVKKRAVNLNFQETAFHVFNLSFSNINYHIREFVTFKAGYRGGRIFRGVSNFIAPFYWALKILVKLHNIRWAVKFSEYTVDQIERKSTHVFTNITC